jgi:hypothetical protein
LNKVALSVQVNMKRKLGDATAAQLTIGREAAPEVELGSVRGQASDRDSYNLSLWKCLAEATQIGLQSADHHWLNIARSNQVGLTVVNRLDEPRPGPTT